MNQKKSNNPADYISALNINGLDGRMIKLDAKKAQTSDILFIYGHHSTLERWWGLIQFLSNYGRVTAPDLPGFGGMDSFYTINKKPTIDNFADYLATFITLKFKNKKIVIVGLSFGFVVVTRMLQRHPNLSSKVILLVSIVGFSHKDDFSFSKTRQIAYLTTSKVFSGYLTSMFFRYVILSKPLLRSFYAKTHNAKHKFKSVKNIDDFNRIINFEIELWRVNDLRTWMYTTNEFLRLDNCRSRVNLVVWHVGVKNDNYLNINLVEQHMKVIFEDYKFSLSNLDNHAPSIIADEKMASPLIPLSLKKQLNKLK